MKSFGFNAVKFVILIVFALIFIATNTAYSGGPNPPTGDEHLAGPAIVGQVIVSPLTGGGVHIFFMGNCKGKIPVDSGFDLETVDFDDVTKETLKYQRQIGAAALVDPECSQFTEGDLIISSVIRFTEIGGPDPVKTADVVVLFVVGQGR